jgi:hypothetical protein
MVLQQQSAARMKTLSPSGPGQLWDCGGCAYCAQPASHGACCVADAGTLNSGVTKLIYHNMRIVQADEMVGAAVASALCLSRVLVYCSSGD